MEDTEHKDGQMRTAYMVGGSKAQAEKKRERN